jgi:RHS repeat-associated protein
MADAGRRQPGSSGSLTNPFQYKGREFDAETSLYYYRSRYYDSQAGRFTNEDQIRFKAGINFYSYVGNSPTDLVDPSGNYAKLNPNSRCAEVFANGLKTGLCAKDFAEAFNEAASKVPIYTVRSPNSPASMLTQNAVTGNGSQQTVPIHSATPPANLTAKAACITTAPDTTTLRQAGS